MRTGVVLVTVVLALALGIAAGVSESRLLVRVLVIGFAPALWAALYAIERLTGRGLWHFTAPYPYRRMRAGKATPAPAIAVEKPVANAVESDDSSTLPLAA